jgi:hypothetical protein
MLKTNTLRAALGVESPVTSEHDMGLATNVNPDFGKPRQSCGASSDSR